MHQMVEKICILGVKRTQIMEIRRDLNYEQSLLLLV